MYVRIKSKQVEYRRSNTKEKKCKDRLDGAFLLEHLKAAGLRGNIKISLCITVHREVDRLLCYVLSVWDLVAFETGQREAGIPTKTTYDHPLVV